MVVGVGCGGGRGGFALWVRFQFGVGLRVCHFHSLVAAVQVQMELVELARHPSQE